MPATTIMPPRLDFRPSVPLRLSITIVAIISTSVVAGCWLILTPDWIRSESALASSGDIHTFISNDSNTFTTILLRNLSVALFVFSGVATFGVTSIIAVTVVSLPIGIGMRLVTESAGWARLLADTWPYIAFEFTGFIVAGAAGLLPALTALQISQTGSVFTRYSTACVRSVKLLGCAVILITAGAVVESILIESRSNQAIAQKVEPCILNIKDHIL